jgi:hypothetical protein
VPRLLVRNFSISLDGYAAGPHQDLDHPLGIGGTQLHEWIFATRSGSQMVGNDGGNEGLDDEFFSKRGSGVDATIMGRNMFGPIRGPWSSCSLTNRMLLSKCRGEQPSMSSTVGSKKLSGQPSKRPVTVMPLSEVAQPPSGGTFALRSSTKSTLLLCPSCWVAANDCSTISAPVLTITAVWNTFVHQP